jgi:NAD-dependent deacetylase
MKRKRIVVFTGAGISAESGLKTFRDTDGLWENFNISDVATPEAWNKDPEKVLGFYNTRRKQTIEAKPNVAHMALAKLEDKYEVFIITQNIDDLHERAGSSKVLHLHGEIRKAQSSRDSRLVYNIKGSKLQIGDKCEMGSQLRPNVVWFGEPVFKMGEAYEIVIEAHIFIVVGTSLSVYPAAGLLDMVPLSTEKYLIDPADIKIHTDTNLVHIKEKASIGLSTLASKLLNENSATFL